MKLETVYSTKYTIIYFFVCHRLSDPTDLCAYSVHFQLLLLFLYSTRAALHDQKFKIILYLILSIDLHLFAQSRQRRTF